MRNNCIIILNYNDSERVISLVKRIADYNSLQHIVVVDNCSADDSYEQLKRIENNKIDVIKTKENLGYAFGNNFGANYAMNKWNIDILFFANPDIFFEEEVINTIEMSLFMCAEYGVAAPLVRDGYNVWDLPKYWGTVRMLYILLFTAHKRKLKANMMQTAGIYEAGVVEGSFFAIKASIFREVGGFDERTFLYLEENILSFKLRQHGYKEIVNADIIYLHEHSKSISKEYKSKANAFKLFKPSFAIYLRHYLNCGVPGMILFDIFYMIAYLERMIYDMIRYVKNKRNVT